MIMLFQMFSIQWIYIAVWEAKLCYYVITIEKTFLNIWKNIIINKSDFI